MTHGRATVVIGTEEEAILHRKGRCRLECQGGRPYGGPPPSFIQQGDVGSWFVTSSELDKQPLV